MIERHRTEEALYRVAVSAFTHYPGKDAKEPGYTVDEDINWCIAPLLPLPPQQAAQMRETIRELITNPQSDRQAFIAALDRLTGE
ncbi:hypothetical protein [Microbacterium sp. zg.B48]|uniref:hypothetical protein n=1 Tax=Microbacterium sp. zg.B48 TaxID=2969408 RepID=UPI00214BBE7F|nr:hypothetical protein [Microbacterium sp. zg.B48]